MAKKAKPHTEPTRCPITNDPRRRLASNAETDAILDNFPEGIARPALRALVAAGISRLEDLATISEHELPALHGMGPKAAASLKLALSDRGLSFRD